MANNIQESILKAVDFLVKDRVESVKSDKTITANIITCTNALTGEYKVSYQGGFMFAYAQEGATYSQNTTVYVLVPEGDFSKKKIILSKAQHLDGDENISFISSALSSYNLIGKNTITDKNKKLPGKMFSYKKENYLLLYQYGDAENSLIQINGEELTNYLQNADAVLLEASFKTRLPKAHRYSKTGDYGLQFVIAFKDGDKTDEDGNALIKYLPYTLDMANMTGNPYLFTDWSEQYNIFNMDVKNFLYIDSILAYAKDFVEKDDSKQMVLWGEDIFFKDLEIYGLKKISATNGEYKLTLSTPEGATFKSILKEDSLRVVGKIAKKNLNISDSTTFYWFAEDGRVTASSEDYQMYGGAGWKRLKDKGTNYTFTTYANENRAYENKYLCVAVYQEQVILKEEFTIYNDACKRNIAITSDLGVKFSFDRGVPTLTCLIDEKESDFEKGKPNPHPDEYFEFIWSKVDDYGQVITFNQTYAELKQEYEEKKGEATYSELAAIKNKMAQMEHVEFEKGKNKLKYPINRIDARATFKCAVYLKDTKDSDRYYIGSAEILLQNENSEAIPTDYHIMIENGDQVFQYSESGVSPANERYADPLKVKPLTAHFYDPAGLEVNKDTYTIKWKVPLEESLIIVPTEGMEVNPSNNKIEYCVSQLYPTAIEENFDYQALNNQITAVVTYKDQEYTKDTTFLFTKVGENGTNGTDIVGRIRPISKHPILDKELLYLKVKNGKAVEYNTGESANSEMFTFDLYQRDKMMEVDKGQVLWNVAGGSSSNSKFLTVIGGIVDWDIADSEKRKCRNQIIKASTAIEGQTYYAFYPLPVVENKNDSYRIVLNKTKTLKNITYNADGRNPLYNKNQGISISLKNGEEEIEKYIVWDAFGGVPIKANAVYLDDPANCAFSLIKEKNSKDGVSHLEGQSLKEIYILPHDTYTGEFSNNVVRGRIYTSKEHADNNSNYEAEIYIPIYMSLNQFGLASLNSWDGNHVEINEDENYILAPQIGAGKKDKENKFTGVVMGTAKTYDQKEESIGLLGYSAGKQSIWLDSETGKAVFGLPEQQASAENMYTEGRIELVPGGESKIGMWNIGSRAIYNITEPVNPDEPGKYPFKGVAPDKPYKDYKVRDSQISVPHSAQGMIINANPAYLSVKGMPLTDRNSDIAWNEANTTIRPNESLEVEIDPRKSSVFSIYRHYKDEEKGRWARYPLVGINQNGQFYSNALKDGESTMGIGKIGAFGTQAVDAKYIGAQFGYLGTNLLKFYIAPGTSSAPKTSTLFLSTGTDIRNEYPRAIQIHGESVSLHAKPDSSVGGATADNSNHKIEVGTEEIYIGHDRYARTSSNSASGNPNHLLLHAGNSSQDEAQLAISTNFALKVSANRETLFSLGDTENQINGNLSSMVNGKTEAVFQGNYIKNCKKDLSLLTPGYLLDIKGQYFTLASTSTAGGKNAVKINLQPTGTSNFDFNSRFALLSKSGVSITSQGSGEGVKLVAIPPGGSESNGCTLKLLPQSGGATKLACSIQVPGASLYSIDAVGASGGSGWRMSPGLEVDYIHVTGGMPNYPHTGGSGNRPPGLVVSNECIVYDDIKITGPDGCFCLYNSHGLWWPDWWLDKGDFQKMWNWYTRQGEFDSLKNAFYSHTHNFSVSGQATVTLSASEIQQYASAEVQIWNPDGVPVSNQTLVAETGYSAGAKLKVSGSATKTVPVNISGTSSGPNY